MLENSLLDYRLLTAAPIAFDPYPHIVVDRFIPEAALVAIREALPSIPTGGSFPASSLKLGKMAQSLVRELEGDRLKGIVASKFGIDVGSAPSMLTLRGMTREKDGRIHRDSDSKLVTILLYLNPPSPAWEKQEGCLRLLRGPHDIDDYAVEVAPVNGTLVIFPNAPGAWHGHRPFTGERYTIQVNYMESIQAARRELRRHGLSAIAGRYSPRRLCSSAGIFTGARAKSQPQ